MRTIHTLVACAIMMILAATTTMNAQDNTRVKTSRWSIGPKAGLNLSHFWGSDFNNDAARMRLSGQFGAFATWSNDSWFAVSGELLYSGKGTRYRYESPWGDAVSVTRVDYIEMPILFRFFFVRDGMFRPHASIGPSWGILLLAHSKGLEPVKSDANSFYDTANKIDLGMNVGGGVNIRVGDNIWINPELRYNLGLLNIGENSSVRNGALTFAVGVGFPIGSN